MSVLQTITDFARALLPWDRSTRERAVKVCYRIEGSIEAVDKLKRTILVRKAREASSQRHIHVGANCKITQMGQALRLEHLHLYDHVWVIFNKINSQLEAVDIEVMS